MLICGINAVGGLRKGSVKNREILWVFGGTKNTIMSIISCPTPLQIHHLNFQSPQIRTFGSVVICGQIFQQFILGFNQNFPVNMTTYEAGTKVAIPIKKEKFDEEVGPCYSESKSQIATEKIRINEIKDIVKNKGMKDIKETNEENENRSTNKAKNSLEVKQQQQQRQISQGNQEGNFAQTNKFSIFNLLNTEHRKPASASCPTATAGAASGSLRPVETSLSAAAGSASTSRPDTSRQLPVTALQLTRKRSPSLFNDDEEEDEG